MLYTPDHDATFGGLGRAGAAGSSTFGPIGPLSSGSATTSPTCSFREPGPEVGATILIPTGRSTPTTRSPGPRPRADGGQLPLCAPPRPDLLVTCAGGWRVSVPEASDWPVRPARRPRRSPAGPARAGRCRPGRPGRRPGRQLRLAWTACSPPHALHGLAPPAPDRRWGLAQRPRPLPHRPPVPVAGHAPLVAAAEVGAGIYFNPVAPEAAASTLRDA